MDPNVALQLALLALDATLQLINEIKAQGGLTADQIMANADAKDLANKDQIKALLAL